MPALIAARHDPDAWDQLGGIHRIFLNEDGRLYEGKPCRMSLGGIKNGRAILWPAKQHLIIAEAVEDALVIRQKLGEIGLDWVPGLSALGCSRCRCQSASPMSRS